MMFALLNLFGFGNSEDMLDLLSIRRQLQELVESFFLCGLVNLI